MSGGGGGGGGGGGVLLLSLNARPHYPTEHTIQSQTLCLRLAMTDQSKQKEASMPHCMTQL